MYQILPAPGGRDFFHNGITNPALSAEKCGRFFLSPTGRADHPGPAIGQSENCAKALFEISRNPWDAKELAYSFYCEPKPLPVHNFMERANDLIGNNIEQYGTVPAYQFREGT
jgi:hypothetical protein